MLPSYPSTYLRKYFVQSITEKQINLKPIGLEAILILRRL